MGLQTFPSERLIQERYEMTPRFMRPSKVPYAVALEGVLTDEECDAIIHSFSEIEPYSFDGCGGITRECEEDPSLRPIETIARNVNELYFRFDLDPGHHSWMQTYGVNNAYQRHTDGAPGQTRKLTAVAMLSDEIAYWGGHLGFYTDIGTMVAPRARGTVIVFQHWVPHEVSPVQSGIRQTINMGFWGPPFR